MRRDQAAARSSAPGPDGAAPEDASTTSSSRPGAAARPRGEVPGTPACARASCSRPTGPRCCRKSRRRPGGEPDRKFLAELVDRRFVLHRAEGGRRPLDRPLPERPCRNRLRGVPRRAGPLDAGPAPPGAVADSACMGERERHSSEFLRRLVPHGAPSRGQLADVLMSSGAAGGSSACGRAGSGRSLFVTVPSDSHQPAAAQDHVGQLSGLGQEDVLGRPGTRESSAEWTARVWSASDWPGSRDH